MSIPWAPVRARNEHSRYHAPKLIGKGPGRVKLYMDNNRWEEEEFNYYCHVTLLLFSLWILKMLRPGDGGYQASGQDEAIAGRGCPGWLTSARSHLPLSLSLYSLNNKCQSAHEAHSVGAVTFMDHRHSFRAMREDFFPKGVTIGPLVTRIPWWCDISARWHRPSSVMDSSYLGVILVAQLNIRTAGHASPHYVVRNVIVRIGRTQ